MYLQISIYNQDPRDPWSRAMSTHYVSLGSLWEHFVDLSRRLWGFAGLHSLWSENLYFQVWAVPGRHSFDHFSRCSFQGVFLRMSFRDFVIWGPILTLSWAPYVPYMGSLWAPWAPYFEQIGHLGCGWVHWPFLGLPNGSLGTPFR